MIITIDAGVGDLAAASREEMEFLFTEVARASMQGKHFVLLDRVICDWALANLTLSGLNCPHFRPDTQHKQEGSSTGLRIGLCLTSFDRLI